VGRRLEGHRRVLAPAGAVIVLLLVVAGLLQLGRFGRPTAALYPVRLVAELPAGCRLLNPYGLGGLVILERPDVAVSIDSRNDLYGRALVEEDERTVDGRDPDARLLARAGCALLPAASPLVRSLEADAAWRRLDGTAGFVLLAR
jgi:hypothetical protein